MRDFHIKTFLWIFIDFVELVSGDRWGRSGSDVINRLSQSYQFAYCFRERYSILIKSRFVQISMTVESTK